MENLCFSGYIHGDRVSLRVHPDNRVEVICGNDGYPSPMSGGGYSLDMPEHLVRNYNQKEFISWLEANFWHGVTIDICNPVDEEVVKAFLEETVLKNLPKALQPIKDKPGFWEKLYAKLKKIART